MSLSRVHGMGLRGASGYPVLVELDLAPGLPAYSIVGLPDGAVKEARERVVAAVRNSGFAVPNRRVTVNLAPARPRKEGSHYDLPIALALLSASGQLEGEGAGRRWCALGELALDGRVRPVPGVLAMAARAKAEGYDAILVPEENAAEAAAAGLPVLPAADLREAAALAAGAAPRPVSVPPPALPAPVPDLAEVRGQEGARRALELAAAGGHNLLMVGPPGTGKSMLARRLPGLLPPLSEEEAVEVTMAQSACGRSAPGLVRERPFRAPHHTASAAALTGGGPSARAGEACLAHGGVLFLDELAEFSRPALECLRQPLEDRAVRVSRARDAAEYPARFMLVAACNPCPCGWRGHPRKACVCAPAAVARYFARLSGPLLDRLDLQVETTPVEFADWAGPATGEPTAAVAARVALARARQEARWGSGRLNATAPAGDFRAAAEAAPEAMRALEAAAKTASLSARALDRVLRVARTAADLAGEARVKPEHVYEAARLRGLDRLRAGLEAASR